ncbi:hypothetical protein BLKGLAD_25930 [Burkholderia gladioli pv. gladioli]
MNKRLPDFQIATASDEQKAVLEDILSGPRGSLNGPFLGWIFSPELAQNAQKLGAFCRYNTGLPLRLSELAILVTAARWRSQAEWHIHCPIALEAGLPTELAEALRTGETPVNGGRNPTLDGGVAQQRDAMAVQPATLERVRHSFRCVGGSP